MFSNRLLKLPSLWINDILKKASLCIDGYAMIKPACAPLM